MNVIDDDAAEGIDDEAVISTSEHVDVIVEKFNNDNISHVEEDSKREYMAGLIDNLYTAKALKVLGLRYIPKDYQRREKWKSMTKFTCVMNVLRCNILVVCVNILPQCFIFINHFLGLIQAILNNKEVKKPYFFGISMIYLVIQATAIVACGLLYWVCFIDLDYRRILGFYNALDENHLKHLTKLRNRIFLTSASVGVVLVVASFWLLELTDGIADGQILWSHWEGNLARSFIKWWPFNWLAILVLPYNCIITALFTQIQLHSNHILVMCWKKTLKIVGLDLGPISLISEYQQTSQHISLSSNKSLVSRKSILRSSIAPSVDSKMDPERIKAEIQKDNRKIIDSETTSITGAPETDEEKMKWFVVEQELFAMVGDVDDFIDSSPEDIPESTVEKSEVKNEALTWLVADAAEFEHDTDDEDDDIIHETLLRASERNSISTASISRIIPLKKEFLNSKDDESRLPGSTTEQHNTLIMKANDADSSRKEPGLESCASELDHVSSISLNSLTINREFMGRSITVNKHTLVALLINITKRSESTRRNLLLLNVVPAFTFFIVCLGLLAMGLDLPLTCSLGICSGFIIFLNIGPSVLKSYTTLHSLWILYGKMWCKGLMSNGNGSMLIDCETVGSLVATSRPNLRSWMNETFGLPAIRRLLADTSALRHATFLFFFAMTFSLFGTLFITFLSIEKNWLVQTTNIDGKIVYAWNLFPHVFLFFRITFQTVMIFIFIAGVLWTLNIRRLYFIITSIIGVICIIGFNVLCLLIDDFRLQGNVVFLGSGVVQILFLYYCGLPSMILENFFYLVALAMLYVVAILYGAFLIPTFSLLDGDESTIRVFVFRLILHPLLKASGEFVVIWSLIKLRMKPERSYFLIYVFNCMVGFLGRFAMFNVKNLWTTMVLGLATVFTEIVIWATFVTRYRIAAWVFRMTESSLNEKLDFMAVVANADFIIEMQTIAIILPLYTSFGPIFGNCLNLRQYSGDEVDQFSVIIGMLLLVILEWLTVYLCSHLLLSQGMPIIASYKKLRLTETIVVGLLTSLLISPLSILSSSYGGSHLTPICPTVQK